MTLESRLNAVLTQIGTDIKDLYESKQDAATANPADAFSDIKRGGGVTLTNNGVTANFSGGQSVALLEGAAASGKYYFEITFTSGQASGDCAVGIATDATPLNTQLGFDSGAGSAGMFQGSGNIYADNQYQTAGTGFSTAGITVCVALDASARLVWFRANGGNWNGSGTANPATNSGGISIGGTGVLYGGVCTPTAASFTAALSSFAYAIPSGFNPWSNLPGDVVATVTYDSVVNALGFTPMDDAKKTQQVLIAAKSANVITHDAANGTAHVAHVNSFLSDAVHGISQFPQVWRARLSGQLTARPASGSGFNYFSAQLRLNDTTYSAGVSFVVSPQDQTATYPGWFDWDWSIVMNPGGATPHISITCIGRAFNVSSALAADTMGSYTTAGGVNGGEQKAHTWSNSPNNIRLEIVTKFRATSPPAIFSIYEAHITRIS